MAAPDHVAGIGMYRIELQRHPRFCADLSLAPRGHSIVKDDQWDHVYCFAEREHAERFQARFGGEWFDPARRGRGSSWMRIKPPRTKYY